VTMQVFVRQYFSVIVAPIQCDVDGIPKGSHDVLHGLRTIRTPRQYFDALQNASASKSLALFEWPLPDEPTGLSALPRAVLEAGSAAGAPPVDSTDGASNFSD